ncbi:hypothetical protein H4Q26_010494 [Puccinia striiformis f. sp. tritici PST-130]|nr:hypothetical protein H4Q26_010494 [Puccinia striiformis f. sp. tritici PST-130]
MVSDLLSMTYLLHAFDVPGRAPNYNSFIAVTERLNSRFEASQRGKPGDLPDSSHYVDLIFQELYKPISKDHNPTDGTQPHSSTYITNKAGPKETALNRLQRTLPIWKRQLAAFTRLLDSSESQKEPQQGKYNAVLDAEGELEVATLYLSYDIARLCSNRPDPMITPPTPQIIQATQNSLYAQSSVLLDPWKL